jgi:hypothetical protein
VTALAVLPGLLPGVLDDSSTMPGWFQLGIVAVGTIVAVIAGGAAFAYMYRRHSVFVRGVRGTAIVVDVRPTSAFQRHSVIERATENVTIATSARPRGVTVAQKLPAGQYQVGQVVDVVQAKGNPDRIFLYRPDLERSALGVYSPLFVMVMIPVILYAALTGPG